MVDDSGRDFLVNRGSLIRVVVTVQPTVHAVLERELVRLADATGLQLVCISAKNCDKLQFPHKVVASIAQELDLREFFRDCAREVWRRMGYVTTECSVRRVSELHGVSMMELRQDFRSELGSFLREGPQMSRDFNTAIRRVLNGVIDGSNEERVLVGQFLSYLLGLLPVRELFQLGVQRKVARDTATSTLRNLLSIPCLAGRAGTIAYLDLRWTTDHEQLTGLDRLGPTRQARSWIYQWVRELIDSQDRFSSTLMCVEFGPSFIDADLYGRGWGIYDALRLRLEDGVRPADGPNPSAPFVLLGSLS
jgi:hypothetical protein